jgi:hypothetical protein
MKSNTGQNKKILKLKIDPAVNFKLIGISSHENDYRLVWAINNQLNMKFIRTESLVVTRQQLTESLEFSCFKFYDEERYLTYSLISNRCPDGFLFREIRNFDFLLRIQGEMGDKDLADFNKKIKTVAVISASFILKPEDLKTIEQIMHD